MEKGALRGARNMPLNRQEEKALAQLMEKLKKRLGARLRHAFLFGSKARGDDRPDSDVDVAIVLEGQPSEEDREEVSEMVYEVLDACGLYIQTVVISAEEFEHPAGQLRWLTAFVREEGVPL